MCIRDRILISLGHPEAEARSMVTTAAESGKKIKDVETFLQLVYEQRTAE